MVPVSLPSSLIISDMISQYVDYAIESFSSSSRNFILGSHFSISGFLAYPMYLFLQRFRSSQDTNFVRSVLDLYLVG
jgi:hypothetical protein